MESIGKIFTGLVMIVVATIIAGFMLFKLWVWFIIPVFPSLPTLTFAQAVGITVFLTVIFGKRNTKDRDYDEIVESFFNELIYTALVFLFAWIVYLFIH
jgi:hypothetical protein